MFQMSFGRDINLNSRALSTKIITAILYVASYSCVHMLNCSQTVLESHSFEIIWTKYVHQI